MNFLDKLLIMKYLLTVWLILLMLQMFGQNTVSIFGRVVDAKTNEPLIGVNIILDDSQKGTTTDLDGEI